MLTESFECFKLNVHWVAQKCSENFPLYIIYNNFYIQGHATGPVNLWVTRSDWVTISYKHQLAKGEMLMYLFPTGPFYIYANACSQTNESTTKRDPLSMRSIQPEQRDTWM